MLKYLLSLSFLGLVIMSNGQDLKVISHTVPNEIIQYQQFFGTTVKVANEGILPAGNFYGNAHLSQDDKFDGEFADPSIGYFYTGGWDPNSVHDVPIVPVVPVTLAPGQYHLIIVLDTNGDVSETDEGNNTFVDFPITVLPSDVDLSFVSINIDADVVAAGSAVNVAYTVQNTGTTQLQGNAHTAFFLSTDQTLDDSDVMMRVFNNDMQLGTSAISDKIVVPIVSPGAYFIIGKVDYANQGPNGTYGESNETNNLTTFPVTIQSPDIDLKAGTIGTFSISQHDFYQGYFNLSLDYSLTNNGTSSVTDFKVGYYLSDDNVFDPGDYLITSQNFPGGELKPGETESVFTSLNYLSLALPPGDYYVIVKLNNDEALPERDYANNTIVSADLTSIAEPLIFYVELESAKASGNIAETDTQIDVQLVFHNPSPGNYDWAPWTSFRLLDTFGNEVDLGYVRPELWVAQGATVEVLQSFPLSHPLSAGNYTMDITTDRSHVTIPVQVGNTISLNGTVVKEDGGWIYKGKMHLYEHTGNAYRPVKSFSMTESADFHFDVKSKMYTLYFVPDKTLYPEYVPTIYDRAVTVGDADDFSVTGDLSLDFTVLKLKTPPSGGRAITGTIGTNASSGRLASMDDVPVMLLKENDDVIGLSYTNTEGAFNFSGLAQGNYRVVVAHINAEDLEMNVVSVTVSDYDLSIFIDTQNNTSTIKSKPTLLLPSFGEKAFGDESFQPQATSNTDQSITYTSSNPSVADYKNGSIEIYNAGTTIITARQEASGEFIAAEVQQELLITKANQTITFAALDVVAVTAAPIVLEATSSLGLPVSYTSASPEIASVENNILTIHRAGSTGITAIQEGNDNVNPAASVVRVLTVSAILGVSEERFIDAHPNPTQGKVTLPTITGIRMIAVFDSLGKPVNAAVDHNTVDFTACAPGVYFLKINASRGIRTIKIIRR